MEKKLAMKRSHSRIVAFILFGILTLMPTMAAAQAAKLSLADLLIGLRSQKVTLEERNTILTEAVKVRGITFAPSAVIEAELTSTGASAELIAAIREVSQPKIDIKPAATPTPDHTFYAKRADANAGKGEFALAVADYDKALEIKSDDAVILAGRGRSYLNLRSYDKALADYDKVVELSPKDASAYFFRGLTYERAGKREKALEDYRKALEIDPSDEMAKGSVDRFEAEAAKVREAARLAEAAKQKPVEPAPKPVRPDFLNVGTLTADNAERLVTPTYPPMAHRANIEGRVVVDVELNEKGQVTSAKALSGHQMLRQSAEDAAKRSRFKPNMFDGTPIKAKGIVVYNFNLLGSRK